MNKYKQFCPIRKSYKQMSKALDVSTVTPNILKQHFNDIAPRYVILTDITYLFYRDCQKCYVSVMKEAYTNEILDYAVSSSMENDLVLDTVKMCMSNHKHEIPQNTLIHSDKTFIIKLIHLNSYYIIISYDILCLGKHIAWDNAPQKSFFVNDFIIFIKLRFFHIKMVTNLLKLVTIFYFL